MIQSCTRSWATEVNALQQKAIDCGGLKQLGNAKPRYRNGA
jgi:hypothetical protein